MTLASVSSRSTAATYSSPAVAATRHVHRHRHEDDDSDAAPAAPARATDGPGRRNPLVAAMMSALKSLMPSGASTAAATTPSAPAAASTAVATTTTAATTAATSTATTATATPAAADPATALRDAAYAFAHELYNALRGGNSGGGQGDGEGAHHHHRRHHHHHHRAERSEGGYGDLAQRLTALAQKLDGTAASPTPATPTTPVTPAAATPQQPGHDRRGHSRGSHACQRARRHPPGRARPRRSLGQHHQHHDQHQPRGHGRRRAGGSTESRRLATGRCVQEDVRCVEPGQRHGLGRRFPGRAAGGLLAPDGAIAEARGVQRADTDFGQPAQRQRLILRPRGATPRGARPFSFSARAPGLAGRQSAHRALPAGRRSRRCAAAARAWKAAA